MSLLAGGDVTATRRPLVRRYGEHRHDGGSCHTCASGDEVLHYRAEPLEEIAPAA